MSTDFSFDDEPAAGVSRYGNSLMDNELAGEMSQPLPQKPPPQQPQRQRQRQQKVEPQQPQQLYDQLTEQNTRMNAKNIGYDPTEFMVADEDMLQMSEANSIDFKYFIYIMLGLILFFQVFIVFKLFFQSKN